MRTLWQIIKNHYAYSSSTGLMRDWLLFYVSRKQWRVHSRWRFQKLMAVPKAAAVLYVSYSESWVTIKRSSQRRGMAWYTARKPWKRKYSAYQLTRINHEW